MPVRLRLAPRIGLAWALPDHKTVIRSGFGIYTNQAAYNIIQNAALNLPFYFAKTVTNSTVTGGTPGFNTENILTASGSVSANNLNHDFKIEYNNVWNLSVAAQPLLHHVVPGAIHRIVYRPCRQRDVSESLPGQRA